MPNSILVSTIQNQGNYYELPQGVALSQAILQEWETMLRTSAIQHKKCLLCLPPHFTFDKPAWESFIDFLKESLHGQYMFVSQEGVKWGDGWLSIIQANVPIAEKVKGIAWITQQETPPTSVNLYDFNKQIRYVKFTGLANQAIQQFPKVLEQAISGFDMRTKATLKPIVLASTPHITWSCFSNAIIFDVAVLQMLDGRFFKAIASMLRKHNMKPDSTGLYFVTASCFENWIARSAIGAIREVSNIVRVVSEHANPDAVKFEVENLYQQCQNMRPSPFILTHQVEGIEMAGKLLEQFYPDIVVADDVSDANTLRTKVGPSLQEHIYHVTPANDPGMRLLQPQLITKGYDINLFAEYLLSRYNNLHGSPNDTYFYYLDAQPTSLKKGSNFFLMEFAEILSPEHQKTIQKVAECETKPNSQGSFTISVLQQKILKLDLRLPFTNQGGAQFLNNYKELFAQHCQMLCEPLRLFLKGDRDLPTIAVLHLGDDYNEFLIRQQGFEIEARFQAMKAVLTVKAAPSESLERRCFALFTLLNSSSVFSHLPDKEILIEIISLMWKNYTQSGKPQEGQGFLITITATEQNCRMKIYQSEQNRIFLEALEENGEKKVTLLANIPFLKDSQKHLLKIVSLLYTDKSPQANNWRFACFEAMSQVTANTIAPQKMTLEFGLKGTTQRAIIISSSKDFNVIQAKSRSVIEAGADRSHITQDCRQISMAKNPSPHDPEIAQLSTHLQDELNNLQEKAILQEVQDEKDKEAQARSLKFQKIYGQALESYNQKYGFTSETQETSDSQVSGKTLVQALSTNVMRRKENPEKAKIQKILIITLASIAAVFIILTTIMFSLEGKPTGDTGMIWQDAENPRYSAEQSATEPKVNSTVQNNTSNNPIPNLSIENYASGDIINTVCFTTNSDAPPTQEELNAMLKMLYFSKIKDADTQNMTARLYLYKIYLDREEKLFKPEQKEKWLQEVLLKFASAKEEYQKNPARSNINICLNTWKPEKFCNPNENIQVIQYNSPQDAVIDIQLILDNMAAFAQQK